jgi:YegS/Rv2252/BmrU family lipid kinase
MRNGRAQRPQASVCQAPCVLRVALIVNPAAGRGAVRRQVPRLLRAFARVGAVPEVLETCGPLDAARLVGECRRRGVDVIAVAGGDGTLNEVSQAYVDGDGRPVPGPPIAVLPAGTGGDFRRTLGIADDPDAAIHRLVHGEPRPFDLGWLRFTTHEGRSATRAFVNITSFGLAGLTDRIVNGAPPWIGGRAAFYLATVRALATWRNPPVEVRVDGAPWLASPIVNVMIANGRWFGGGMRIAPAADPSDGAFDVVAVGDRSRVKTLALTRAVYAGTHVGRPQITATRGAEVEARPARPADVVLIDMDGETPGRLPLAARVVPGALWIRA